MDPDLPITADQNIQYFLSTEDERNFTIAEKTGDLTLKGVSTEGILLCFWDEAALENLYCHERAAYEVLGVCRMV